MLLTPTDKRIYVSPTSANTMATTRDYTSWKFSFVDNIHIPSRLQIADCLVSLKTSLRLETHNYVVSPLDLSTECMDRTQWYICSSASCALGRQTRMHLALAGGASSKWFWRRRASDDREYNLHAIPTTAIHH